MDISVKPNVVAREQTVRIVLLNAGKSTRLDGQNKLFVYAGGQPVYRWHQRAYPDAEFAIVTNSDDIEQTRKAFPNADRIVAHDEIDGPAGALSAYLNAYDDASVIVLYADTLIAPQPIPEGDWVGVAPLSNRTWDHRQAGGEWAKVVPSIRVGIGLYSFAEADYLRECLASLGTRTDQHLPTILNAYERRRPMLDLEIAGWHDAGDYDALARVPSF